MIARHKIAIGVALGLIPLLALLFAFDPAQCRLFPSCLFHLTTGLHCPGCGATRAIHHLLHGHLLEAFRLNALATLLAPALLGALLWERLSRNSARPWSLSRISPALIWTLLSVVLLFGVVRNIPFFPFTVMAP